MFRTQVAVAASVGPDTVCATQGLVRGASRTPCAARSGRARSGACSPDRRAGPRHCDWVSESGSQGSRHSAPDAVQGSGVRSGSRGGSARSSTRVRGTAPSVERDLVALVEDRRAAQRQEQEERGARLALVALRPAGREPRVVVVGAEPDAARAACAPRSRRSFATRRPRTSRSRTGSSARGRGAARTRGACRARRTVSPISVGFGSYSHAISCQCA